MRHHPLLWILALLLLQVSHGSSLGQRLDGQSPPIYRRSILLDTRFEDPPVFSGVTTSPLPKRGDLVSLQVFMPEVVGSRGHGYILEFDNTGNVFTENFQIRTARTWVEIPFLDPQTQVLTLDRRELPLQAPLGSKGPGRSILFIVHPIIPQGSLIAELSVGATQDVAPDVPLRLLTSVTVISKTPPMRLWKFWGQQTVRWQ